MLAFRAFSTVTSNNGLEVEDAGRALAPCCHSKLSINNTADDLIDLPSSRPCRPGSRSRERGGRNESKAAGHHVPSRSRDAGQDAGGGPVHEIQEQTWPIGALAQQGARTMNP